MPGAFLCATVAAPATAAPQPSPLLIIILTLILIFILIFTLLLTLIVIVIVIVITLLVILIILTIILALVPFPLIRDSNARAKSVAQLREEEKARSYTSKMLPGDNINEVRTGYCSTIQSTSQHSV